MISKENFVLLLNAIQETKNKEANFRKDLCNLLKIKDSNGNEDTISKELIEIVISHLENNLKDKELIKLFVENKNIIIQDLKIGKDIFIDSSEKLYDYLSKDISSKQWTRCYIIKKDINEKIDTSNLKEYTIYENPTKNIDISRIEFIDLMNAIDYCYIKEVEVGRMLNKYSYNSIMLNIVGEIANASIKYIENVFDCYDLISWWLFEGIPADDKDITIEENGERVSYNVAKIDDFYNFLKMEKEKKVADIYNKERS